MHAVCPPGIICLIAIFILVVIFSAIFVKIHNYKSNPEYKSTLHEGQAIGADGSKAHGPNAVLSMVGHYLTEHCAGTKNLLLHADNCVGQSKNKTVIAYLLWRTMTGLSDNIELFLCVWAIHVVLWMGTLAFLIKQRYRSNVRLYKAFVLPALLYTCCTWGATKACMDRVDAFRRCQLRSLLGIRYPARKSNEELYRSATVAQYQKKTSHGVD